MLKKATCLIKLIKYSQILACTENDDFYLFPVCTFTFLFHKNPLEHVLRFLSIFNSSITEIVNRAKLFVLDFASLHTTTLEGALPNNAT